MDESGINNNEEFAYGYSPKGKRIYQDKPGHRTQRISILAASQENKFIAPCVLEGYVDKAVFTEYCRRILIPQLRTGQILVLDNASFHKGTEIIDLFTKAGIKVKFLPPYCPHLNKIEKLWSALKMKFRLCLSRFGRDLFRAALEAFA